MSTAVTETIARPAAGLRPVLLVFCCTVLGASAQILMKMGVNGLAHPGPAGILTNIPLMSGYGLYGLSTVLLVLALRDGELSLLYPIIALTYVWVAVLSYLIFHDRLNPLRIAGVITIVAGVICLGRANRQ